MPLGQHQDTELWNNQFPETKILGLPVSRRMRGLVYMASRDKVEVDTFHKGIQYALEKLGKSKLQQYQSLKAKDKRALGTSLLIIPELRVLVLTKRHVGSGNEIGYRKNPVKCNACSFARKIETDCFSRNMPISNDPVVRISRNLAEK